VVSAALYQHCLLAEALRAIPPARQYKGPGVSMTDVQRTEARQLAREGMSRKALAIRYGVSPTQMASVCRGIRSKRKPRRKNVSDETIREAIAMHEQGASWTRAAKAVGLHRKTLWERVRAL
jgi:DNA invertase Pin-like site-specific DNA recombinase